MGLISLHVLFFPPQLPVIINNVLIYVVGCFPPFFLFSSQKWHYRAAECPVTQRLIK